MKDRILNSEGFLYGYGLFETMLFKNGRVLFLDDHLKRLFAGAERICLKISQSHLQFKNAIYQQIKREHLANGKNVYVRLNVWAQGKETKFSMITRRYNPATRREYELGWKIIFSTYRLNELSPLAGIKSLNYLTNLLARKEAQDKGYDEAIFLNSKGFISEGTRTNIFIVKNNTLSTPSLNCGVLNGIIRRQIIKLALKNKIKLKETRLKTKDLISADEAFLTNSLIGIMPVASINGLGLRKTRPLTDRFRKYYEDSLTPKLHRG